MNKDTEKLDKSLGKLIREDSLEKVPKDLANTIMHKITGEAVLSKEIKKPILNRWGKIFVLIIYLVILIPLLFTDLSSTSIELIKGYTINIKPLELPSLGDNFNKIFLMVTIAGWFFVFLDNYIKKIIFK